MADELPETVLRFIDDYIDSIELLRVLLLLHNNPERTWTTAEITNEFRSADTSIAKRLGDLYSRKILSRVPNQNDAHRFNPVTEELRAVIEELAEQNRLRPNRVIEAIYALYPTT